MRGSNPAWGLLHGPSGVLRTAAVADAGGVGGVAQYADPVGVCGEQLGVGLVAPGARDFQFEIKLPGGVDIRLAHIVAIADPGHCFALDGAALLDKSLHIGEQLAGVIAVGQGVDDGH